MSRRSWMFVSLVALAVASAAVAQDQGVQSIVGNVLLQDTTPGTAQVGHANIKGTFRAGQVFVQQASGLTTPVVGNNISLGAGAAIGGSFSSGQQSGTGVRGTATATAGVTAGVYGETRSGSGAGVYGKSTGSGASFRDDHPAGVFGEAIDSEANGVFGRNTSSGATGVSGIGDGVGVRGFGTSGTGVQGSGKFTGVGGFCTTGSVANSTAVVGEAFSAGAIGGGFDTSQPGGTGLRGTFSGAQSVGTGIKGRNLGLSGFAVFAEGALGASGTKSFVIDHPFDPEHKTLSHFCTEGEEPLNVYRGSIVTDTNGNAEVRLPDYFEEINTAPTVQLTVADNSSDWVMVKVTREVSRGSFELRTSKPRTKVYWRVEARRNDRWVRKHGAQVETIKPRAQWGTYIEPDLYNQPRSKYVDYKLDQAEEAAIKASGLKR
ncbi:MAG: hypothetical protein JSS66_03655 [Armatimonadetes bacterium]|nr:hypothetical protein [Armatimonadota bacterium]